jgi:hypothetical protein
MSGPIGVTGTQGYQGIRGLIGPPRYAYAGSPYGVNTARITVNSPTSSPIYLTPQNFGTYFNITSNTIAVDQLTVSFPFYNVINSTGTPFTITTVEWFNNTLKITVNATHNLRVQSLVTLAGLTTNPSLNIADTRVLSIQSSVQFTVYVPTTGNILSGETGTVTESIKTESTNELFPTPEQAGSFWALKNNCKSTVYVTFSNGTVKYQGTTGVTSLGLESGNAVSVMYTGANDFTVL